MEESNKTTQEPQTPANTSEKSEATTETTSTFQFDHMKQSALEEIRSLKFKHEVLLRKCINLRRDIVTSNVKSALKTFLEMEQIVEPHFRSYEDEEEEVVEEEEEEVVEEEEEMEEYQTYQNKNKGIIINDASDKPESTAPRIEVEHNAATREKAKGKAPMVDESADKVPDKLPPKGRFKLLIKNRKASPTAASASENSKPYQTMIIHYTKGKAPMGTAPGSSGLAESASGAKEVSELPKLADVGDSLRKVPDLNQKVEEYVPDLNQNVEEYVPEYISKENMQSRKRKLDFVWQTESDMLVDMRTHRWKQMEAICALYRQEKSKREHTTVRLPESHYEKYYSSPLLSNSFSLDN